MKLDPAQRELVQRNPLFGAISDESLDVLLSDASEVTYPADTEIFSLDDPVSHFFLVLSGWVKLFRLRRDGTEFVVEVFGPGESSAQAAMNMGGGYPMNAQSVSPTELIKIPTSGFKDKLRADPDLGIQIITALSLKLKRFVRRIDEGQRKTASQKVADFMLQFGPAPFGLAERASIDLPYDKQLIAARLGMNPETFSRSLARLRLQGVTVEGSTLLVDNVNTLRAFASGE